MKTTLARRSPGTGTPPEALIKEARRRQRRRRAAIGTAVVAVLGSAAGVAAGLHGPAVGPDRHPGNGSPARAASGPAPGLALWQRGGTPALLPYSDSGGISDGFDATARLVAYGIGCTAHATAPDAAYAAVRPQGQGAVRLYVLRRAGQSARPAAVPSSAAFLFARTAWSAKGAWLLYQGPGGHLRAYQVTSGAVRASSVTCCRYTVMVAAPAGPD